MAKKTIKLETGTVYQKAENGSYYFRYQIQGKRQAVSLKTKNQKEAIKKAEELIPIIKADNTEIIAAHVQHAKGLKNKARVLDLTQVWNKYAKHPERATPATVSEQLAYKSTFLEFVDYLLAETRCRNLADVTAEIADQYAQHLRKQPIAVTTHNRKIMRVRKVFTVLKDFRDSEHPFESKALLRKVREEQENTIRRKSFSKEEEKAILRTFDEKKHTLKNKEEIKVVYYLGMFTGQRLKDCVLLQWDRIDLKAGKIWVKQFKTGKEVVIPISAELNEALLEAKTWKRNNLVCPNVAERYNKLDKNGKNTGNNLVNIDVLRPIRWIGLEPSVKMEGRDKKVTVYGFHSLRHSFASHCAEAGVPKAAVVSILGADSKVIDKYYTHVGEEAQLKAIAAISFSKAKTFSPEERVTQALAILEAQKNPSATILEAIKVLKGV